MALPHATFVGMRHALVLAAFVALAATLTRCATTQQTYSLAAPPERQLAFRFGGGITGQFQEYLLFPNGQIFTKREVIDALPFREVEPIDPKLASDFFKTYDQQGFASLDYDDPGNMTYTIRAITGADTTELTWGGTAVKPTEEVRTYWRRAMSTLGGREPVAQGASR